MNQKRKAELQRKLSMTSVPRPPAGLAERIKADIPHDLRSIDRERERFSRSTAFTMRVAASIILLISSVYVTIHLMSRSEEKVLAPAMARKAPAAPQAEVTINVAEQAKETRVAPASSPVSTKAAQRAALRDEKKEKDEQASGVETGFVGGVVSTVAEVPAAVAAPAPPPPPAKMADRAENIVVTAEAPALVKRERADALSFAAPRAIFGLSVDPAAFDRIKQKIEHGQRPEPGTVDVAGLVNYFAGTARPPRRVVRLDVEGSRAPITPNAALIRFTVETPHVDLPPGATLPPIATDADLTIHLNSDAVISHRLVGADTLKAQSTLVKNTSVTGMVDVQLIPAIRPTTTIATLQLRYRSAADGKEHTIVRVVHAAELMRSWASASQRHRLATLGAVWSESLNGGAATGEMARTAERLATEAPGDARARELAAVASAFSRLQTSGPTGSGR